MRKAAPKDEEKKETPVEEEKKDPPAQDTEAPTEKAKEDPAPENEKPGEEKEPKEEPAKGKEDAQENPEEEKTSDDAQADENGEGAEEEPEKEEPGDPAQPTKEEPAAAVGETEQLKKELADARAQLCALRLGVLPEMAQDAVSLAIVQAGENYQEEGLEKAMNEVLKRHPDWKSDKKDQSGGFKLGADPEKAASKTPAKKSGGAESKTKRWNRFKK